MKPLQSDDPQRVGRYQLLGRLGAGGMGQVFLGQSPGGRLVAVKLIRGELAADREFRVRFAREVAAAVRLPAREPGEQQVNRRQSREAVTGRGPPGR